MDLYKLGTDESDLYYNPWQPGEIVEDWSSLIWTERYTEAGDFQLKTPAVNETLALIPDGSFVCVDESREIMRVETHSIAVNDNGVMEATITGRSLETFLEERNINADAGAAYPMLQNYTAQAAVGVVIFNTIRNLTTFDKTGGPFDNDPSRALGHEVSIFDHIYINKEASVSDPPDISDLVSSQEWFLDNGDAYTPVLNWLRLGELGIRTTRPRNSYSVTIDVTNTGTINAETFIKINAVVWDIYNGRNRTITPSEYDPLDPVVFRYDAGHIKSPTYLLSRKGFKNYARIISPDGEIFVWDGDDGFRWGHDIPLMKDPPEGIDRFETIITLENSPSSGDPDAYMRQKGKTELKNKRRQVLLDGAIQPSAPYEFGYDYGLGDYVTVMGEFGVTETMQVNEFIRSQGAEGYQAFPTLIRKALPE